MWNLHVRRVRDRQQGNLGPRFNIRPDIPVHIERYWEFLVRAYYPRRVPDLVDIGFTYY